MKDVFNKIFGDYKWFLIFPALVQLMIRILDGRYLVVDLFQSGVFVLIPVLTIVLLFQKQSSGLRGTIILGFLLWLAAFVWVTAGPGSITPF